MRPSCQFLVLILTWACVPSGSGTADRGPPGGDAPSAPSLPTHDADGDGWTAKGGDCDDNDPGVHPGAEEFPCEAVDRNCDGVANTEPARLQLAGSEEAPARYPSVQTAINAAGIGDTVYVCPGVHDEALQIRDIGELTLAAWSGSPTDTVIDPGGLGWALEASDVGLLRIEGLGFSNTAGIDQPAGCVWTQESFVDVSGAEFSGCEAQVGAGLAVAVPDTVAAEDPAVLRLVDSRFVGNRAQTDAGVYVYPQWTLQSHEHARIEIQGCEFVENEGGAVYVGGTVQSVVQDSRFVDNRAESTTAGLALHAHWAEAGVSAAQVIDTLFQGNHTGGSGGALGFGNTHEGTPLDLELHGSTFLDNTAESGGGAINLELDDGEGLGSRVRIVDTVLEDNRAMHGGAISMENNYSHSTAHGTLTIESTRFVGNNREHDGLPDEPWASGGLEFSGGSGARSSWDVVLEGVSFEENHWAMELWLDHESTVSAEDVEFVGNLDGDECCAGWTARVGASLSEWSNVRFYSNRTPQVLVLGGAHTDLGELPFEHRLEDVDFGEDEESNPGADISGCAPDDQGRVAGVVLTRDAPCP